MLLIDKYIYKHMNDGTKEITLFNTFLSDWEKINLRLKMDFSNNLISETYNNRTNLSKLYNSTFKICIKCGKKKNLFDCNTCKNLFCKNHLYIIKKFKKCRKCHNNYFKNQIDDLFINDFNYLDKEIDMYKSSLINSQNYFKDLLKDIISLKESINNNTNTNKHDNLKKNEYIKKYKKELSNKKLDIYSKKALLTKLRYDVNLIKEKYKTKNLTMKKLKNNPKMWSNDFKNKILYNLSKEIHNKILNLKNLI